MQGNHWFTLGFLAAHYWMMTLMVVNGSVPKKSPIIPSATIPIKNHSKSILTSKNFNDFKRKPPHSSSSILNSPPAAVIYPNLTSSSAATSSVATLNIRTNENGVRMTEHYKPPYKHLLRDEKHSSIEWFEDNHVEDNNGDDSGETSLVVDDKDAGDRNDNPLLPPETMDKIVSRLRSYRDRRELRGTVNTQERVWDFQRGEFRLVTPEKIHETLIPRIQRDGLRQRRHRSPPPPSTTAQIGFLGGVGGLTGLNPYRNVSIVGGGGRRLVSRIPIAATSQHSLGFIQKNRIFRRRRVLHHVRRKRATSSFRRRRQILVKPKLMEVVVYIDQDMYDLYLIKYGSKLADERIKTFVGVMLNTTRALFQHGTLTPRLDISIERITIWKKQPRALRGVGNNGLAYVEAFCNYIRPKSSGFDHATLISGKRLSVGLDIDGIAWQDSMCSDASCTVVRGAFNTAYRHGNTLAHEIGHAMGMNHDGGSTNSCDETCCVMAPKQTGTQWSRCSRQKYQSTLIRTSCLEDARSSRRSGRRAEYKRLLINGPVKQMPGQVLPDEAQCHQIVGTCYRSVPGHEGDCEKHFCTRHKDSTIMTTISEFRLDGSYCGPGKVCEGGVCRRLSSWRRNQLKPINGGWSTWRETIESACGGGTCSQCAIVGQRSMKINVRRCDNPYPRNGGATCLGSQIRGVTCSRRECKSSGKSRLIADRMRYMEYTCKEEFGGRPTTGVIYRKNRSSCDFMCYNRDANAEVPKRYPDGTKCGRKGVCVHGVCMQRACRNKKYFVISERDCP